MHVRHGRHGRHPPRRVLDLTANRRTDQALGSAFTITIDHINAGDDVDLVLNDSKNGNDVSDLTLLVIDLYDPLTGFYNFTFPSTYNPALADGASHSRGDCAGAYPGDCGTGSGRYETHFRPDANDPLLDHILRAFGTVTTDIDSTYDFQAVRAGDDIDICQSRPAAKSPSPARDRGERRHRRHAESFGHDRRAGQDRRHHHQHDIAWRRRRAHRPLDDGLGINVSQTFIRTTANRHQSWSATRWPPRHSTAGDVTLNSPRRILDANRQPTSTSRQTSR